jgi:hypothetical protein
MTLTNKIILVICSLQDWICDTFNSLRHIYLLVVWWYIKQCIIQRRRNVRPIVCTAYCGTNITEAITNYYRYDRVLSTYSMETWLIRCGVSVSTQCTHAVTIIYTINNKLHYSVIDLQNDMEMNTHTKVTDVDLITLPSMKLS